MSRFEKPEQVNPYLTTELYIPVAQKLALRYEECSLESLSGIQEGETAQTVGSRRRDWAVQGIRDLTKENPQIKILDDERKRFLIGINGVATRFFRVDTSKTIPKRMLGRFAKEKAQMHLVFAEDIFNQNIAWRFFVNQDLLTDNISVSLWGFDLKNEGKVVCAYNVPLQAQSAILAAVGQKREEAVPQEHIVVGGQEEERKVVGNE